MVYSVNDCITIVEVLFQLAQGLMNELMKERAVLRERGSASEQATASLSCRLLRPL